MLSSGSSLSQYPPPFPRRTSEVFEPGFGVLHMLHVARRSQFMLLQLGHFQSVPVASSIFLLIHTNKVVQFVGCNSRTPMANMGV